MYIYYRHFIYRYNVNCMNFPLRKMCVGKSLICFYNDLSYTPAQIEETKMMYKLSLVVFEMRANREKGAQSFNRKESSSFLHNLQLLLL